MQDLVIGSIPLLVAIAASLLFYNQPQPRWLRLVTPFLIFTFLTQIAGYYYSKTFKKSNHFVFNTYTLISYLFYFFLFYYTPEIKKHRRLVLLAVVIFMLVFAGKTFVRGSFWAYNPLVNNVGELLLFCCCLLYFFMLLTLDKWSNYFSIPMFWITTGIVFASVGDFVYLSFFNYIMNNKLDLNGVIYGIITTTTSIVEYGLFTVAFLCNKVWTKTK